jgi:hypothetical protein
MLKPKNNASPIDLNDLDDDDDADKDSDDEPLPDLEAVPDSNNQPSS